VKANLDQRVAERSYGIPDRNPDLPEGRQPVTVAPHRRSAMNPSAETRSPGVPLFRHDPCPSER